MKEIPCPLCQKPADYNQYHDAYFCCLCDIWLEKNCQDPKCFYCVKRPEKPSQFNYIDFLDENV